ncbi:MAG: hypothetical protein HY800_02795 [Ignavibacteriales bacterium]|nr:hypothetical protein [Ignavibacteriales bacterium]
MSAEIKTELKIPDLWYDFYSRFLPGVIFVSGLRTLYYNICTFPNLPEVLVLLGAAYIAGLLTQPLSSQIIRFVHYLARKLAKINDPLYIKRIQIRLGQESRPTLILSKMHGEVAFFVQAMTLMAVLSIILWLDSKGSWLWIIVIPLLFACALEVSYRRIKRAGEYTQLSEEGKSSISAGHPVA